MQVLLESSFTASDCLSTPTNIKKILTPCVVIPVGFLNCSIKPALYFLLQYQGAEIENPKFIPFSTILFFIFWDVRSFVIILLGIFSQKSPF